MDYNIWIVFGPLFIIVIIIVDTTSSSILLLLLSPVHNGKTFVLITKPVNCFAHQPPATRAAGQPKNESIQNPTQLPTPMARERFVWFTWKFPPSHPSHLKFQVNRTNSFRVVAVGSLKMFGGFLVKELINFECRIPIFGRFLTAVQTSDLKKDNCTSLAGVFWIWPQNSYIHVLSHCAVSS